LSFVIPGREQSERLFLVMPGLVPGIHVFTPNKQEKRGWP
jgi:hypothetical protein